MGVPCGAHHRAKVRIRRGKGPDNWKNRQLPTELFCFKQQCPVFSSRPSQLSKEPNTFDFSLGIFT